ncbi:predicted protein [Botrytis cinerea T4]|uniref:Uncharacterized protein n=1 Tax=Botryotinia fuckeliana (strain T4) TaxID=999810 RepID=G2XNU0_BOTF4|nr:predicted protein [Botrytis cinerea T4]
MSSVAAPEYERSMKGQAGEDVKVTTYRSPYPSKLKRTGGRPRYWHSNVN